MGCNFEGNWKHTLGTKQINFRLKENKFQKLKKWKRNIFQNICLCGKTFPQNYPTHSAALKNRKKRWSPNFLFGQATKLDSRLVYDPVPQESLTETSCSSVFSIFRYFRFIRRELSLTAKDFHQQILTRKCQISFKSVCFIIKIHLKNC